MIVSLTLAVLSSSLLRVVAFGIAYGSGSKLIVESQRKQSIVLSIAIVGGFPPCDSHHIDSFRMRKQKKPT
jgi:hypothetical protein